jgi:hypothetical protein
MAIIGTAPNQTFQRNDGTRTGAAVCQQEKTAGANNTAVLADARENDIASGLNVMLMKTGGNTPTGNMPMGGFKHIGVGEATGAGQYAEYDQMGDADDVILEAAKDYTDALLEEGTVCVFYQAAAPTGWTKVTTHNDKAIRIVSGTGGGSDGSTAFTTVFAMKTPAGTLDQKTVTVDVPVTGWGTTGSAPGTVTSGRMIVGSGYVELAEDLESVRAAGGAQTITSTNHNHTFTGTAMDFRVQYVDCILATRDAAVH